MKTLLSILTFCLLQVSCNSQNNNTARPATTQAVSGDSLRQPNYNYTVEVPDHWKARDTVMPNGLRIRFILGPDSLIADFPACNILIASMQDREIGEYTNRNMDYLKANGPGITLLKRGSIDSTIYNGQWFTYTKVQNGIARDMINYIIPLNGFAYMITCGANEGKLSKYRAIFDKLAKSFKG